MKTRNVTIIDVDEWNKTVEKIYKRPYSFQQQDGCKERGIFYFSVPDDSDDFENDTLPEKSNHEEMGVSFAAWLKRDPKQVLSIPDNGRESADWNIRIWWKRNFYPEFQTLANDLCSRGELKAGKYAIEIDW
ncbi:MAG: hypothetical protein PHW03_02540 [Eubacteriales bacterium]|nr:hypothetical protein [Eubacteriales bacterium]